MKNQFTKTLSIAVLCITMGSLTACKKKDDNSLSGRIDYYTSSGSSKHYANGATVSLYSGSVSGTPLSTTTSDAVGDYNFKAPLNDGTYYVTATFTTTTFTDYTGKAGPIDLSREETGELNVEMTH